VTAAHAPGIGVVHRVAACRACGSKSLEPFLDLGKQPFANSLLSSADAPEEVYELALALCRQCSMVQLTANAEPSTLFSRYVWVTGTSSTATRHADTFCGQVLNRLGDASRTWACEVASNDGTFLRPFQARGWPVLGVDPAANIVEEANNAGIPTQCAFFGSQLGKRLATERGPASIVVARNVFAHVPDPTDFARGLSALIGEAGIAAIEFHYAGKILDGLQYDSIYHEHQCYMTAGTVVPLLERAGLEVFDIDEGPISGGAMVVYARNRAGGRVAVRESVGRYLGQERRDGVNSIDSWKRFAAAVRRHRELLNERIDREVAAGRRPVGYGASARSSTLLNYCGISADRVPVIADQSPLKHGLYTAGSRIPIRPPEEVFSSRPESVLLLAWNFAKEITGVLQGRLGFSGTVILPLPNDPITIQIN
jgi:hypothetical protein